MKTAEFQDIVNSILKSTDMTQGELADLVGVSPPTVSTWVRGASSPKRENGKKLGEILEMVQDDLPDTKFTELKNSVNNNIDDLMRRSNNRPFKKRIEEAGDILKQLKGELDLSHKEIADFIGVAQSTVSKWVNNTHVPSENNLNKLKEAYRRKKTGRVMDFLTRHMSDEEVAEETGISSEKCKQYRHQEGVPDEDELKRLENAAKGTNGKERGVLPGGIILEPEQPEHPEHPSDDSEEPERKEEDAPEHQEGNEVKSNYREQAVRQLIDHVARDVGAKPRKLRQELKPLLAILDVDINLDSI